jgi:SEC-C motif
MCTERVLMELDRGTLARIDRRVGSGLGHDEVYRTVRVSATDATWSTWKRYCDAAGISMGRAIMELIGNELRSVVAEPAGDCGPVFSGLAARSLESREAQIEARECAVDEAEEWLGHWAMRLGVRKGVLRTLERQVRGQAIQTVRRAEVVNKVGRNERCPCDSGLKYKHCHGLLGRQPESQR